MTQLFKKKVECLEVVHGLNFEFIDPPENKGRKYSLTSDNSFDELCNLKAFFDTPTVGGQHGFDSIHMKNNSLQQTKIRRDAGLQDTHIVLV